jgi:hypothetical protein
LLFNKEGLNMDNPTSSPKELIFIPPKAVAFALCGKVKKLKVAFPAVVWLLMGL